MKAYIFYRTNDGIKIVEAGTYMIPTDAIRVGSCVAGNIVEAEKMCRYDERGAFVFVTDVSPARCSVCGTTWFPGHECLPAWQVSYGDGLDTMYTVYAATPADAALRYISDGYRDAQRLISGRSVAVAVVGRDGVVYRFAISAALSALPV